MFITKLFGQLSKALSPISLKEEVRLFLLSFHNNEKHNYPYSFLLFTFSLLELLFETLLILPQEDIATIDVGMPICLSKLTLFTFFIRLYIIKKRFTSLFVE